MQNNEKNNLGDKINDFVQNNRKVIFILFGALFVLFAGTVAYFSISEHLNSKAILEVEELNSRFESMPLFTEENYFLEEVDILLADLETFAASKSGFPGSKAWSIIGHIYSARKDWVLAENAWLNAAKKGNKTYLAPIALFNAAASVEEQGRPEEAIELLKQCLSHRFEFPAAPRAQFSIGRLYEQLGNYPEALDAYRAVLINWSEMPVWQHLARSRIAAIEIR